MSLLRLQTTAEAAKRNARRRQLSDNSAMLIIIAHLTTHNLQLNNSTFQLFYLHIWRRCGISVVLLSISHSVKYQSLVAINNVNIYFVFLSNVNYSLYSFVCYCILAFHSIRSRIFHPPTHWFTTFLYYGQLFLPNDAMNSADYAVARCLSVCPYITRRYSDATAKRILKLFSPF